MFTPGNFSTSFGNGSFFLFLYFFCFLSHFLISILFSSLYFLSSAHFLSHLPFFVSFPNLNYNFIVHFFLYCVQYLPPSSSFLRASLFIFFPSFIFIFLIPPPPQTVLPKFILPFYCYFLNPNQISFLLSFLFLTSNPVYLLSFLRTNSSFLYCPPVSVYSLTSCSASL